MKRGIKAIIAGVIIAVGGIIMLVCALGASGWDIQQVNDWEVETKNFETKITKLKMEVNVGKVIITPGTDKVVVTYEYNDVYQPQIEQNNDVLSIQTAKRHWYQLIQFGFVDAPTMQIEIPQGWLSEMDLILNAGSLQVDTGDWGQLIEVQVNAGAANFGEVTTEIINVDINAGAFNAKKIASNKVDCDISAGAFNCKEIICEQFDCDISAGAVEVGKLDSAKIDLSVSAGGATLSLVGTKTDYNIKVDKSAGSCNVTSQTNVNATRKLDIDVSAGSANIKFAN